MRRCSIIILVLAALSVLSACSSESVIRESRIAMGTAVTLSFYSRRDAAISDQAFTLLSDIEHMISFHDDSSEVSRINSEAGASPVRVSPELFELIRLAIGISDETEGAFNPLMGSVTSLWNIGSDDARVPSDDEISFAIGLLDTDDVILDESECTVFLSRPGMKLDLGGIGKGYATAVLRDFLIENGVRNAIINLGGNVYAIGKKKGGNPYRIGIADPDGGAYITSVTISDEAVVTSGAYERYSDIDGVRYHHIFTSSGYPSDSDLLSATIVSGDPVIADALSTAVFASGSSSAEALAEKFGVGIIIYDRSHELRTYGL